MCCQIYIKKGCYAFLFQNNAKKYFAIQDMLLPFMHKEILPNGVINRNFMRVIVYYELWTRVGGKYIVLLVVYSYVQNGSLHFLSWVVNHMFQAKLDLKPAIIHVIYSCFLVLLRNHEYINVYISYHNFNA